MFLLRLCTTRQRRIRVSRITGSDGGGCILVMQEGQRTGLALAKPARALEFALIVILEILALMPERYRGVCGHGAVREEENRKTQSAAVDHCSFLIAFSVDSIMACHRHRNNATMRNDNESGVKRKFRVFEREHETDVFQFRKFLHSS